MVYVFENTFSHKVGHTKRNINDRMREIKTGNRNFLVEKRNYLGGKNLEKYLHERLKDSRREGEFFYYSDNYLKELDKHYEKFYPFKFCFYHENDTLVFLIDCGVNSTHSCNELKEFFDTVYGYYLVPILNDINSKCEIRLYSKGKYNDNIYNVIYLFDKVPTYIKKYINTINNSIQIDNIISTTFNVECNIIHNKGIEIKPSVFKKVSTYTYLYSNNIISGNIEDYTLNELDAIMSACILKEV